MNRTTQICDSYLILGTSAMRQTIDGVKFSRFLRIQSLTKETVIIPRKMTSNGNIRNIKNKEGLSCVYEVDVVLWKIVSSIKEMGVNF